MFVDCGSHKLDLSAPVVMGVLNVTPDSFSDGGAYFDLQHALARAHAMVAQGARIIDIGGESTRPGAAAVSAHEELRRVIPVIEAVAAIPEVLVSIDTSKAEVITAATAAGAVIINDVHALTAPGALAAAANTSAAICLMHMQGQPATMQSAPYYDDVVARVRDYLQARVSACEQAGIARERLLLDPGIGFGKSLQHNLSLLARLAELAVLQCPLLIGVSRKSMIGQLLDRSVEQRVSGSVALATAAVLAGAKIIRAHDIAATVDAVRVAIALRDAGFATATNK